MWLEHQLTLDITLQNMITSTSLTWSCHLSYLSPLFVNIHTHDGKLVFYYSHICFCINFHSSFLHMFEDSSTQQSRVCTLAISKSKGSLWYRLTCLIQNNIHVTFFKFIFSFLCLYYRVTGFSIMKLYVKIMPCFWSII